jgi:uncharacterized membrane protein (DUF2068 family)
MLLYDAAASGMKHKFISRQRNVLRSVGVINAVKMWFKSVFRRRSLFPKAGVEYVTYNMVLYNIYIIIDCYISICQRSASS